MAELSILSDEFAEKMAAAGRRARQAALDAGFPVVFLDGEGRYVQEWPDGRMFEVRFDPSASGDAHCVVVRELVDSAA
ncbi:MAG: hypothetical protein H6509_00395 [Bryobacterales bacterium]|nr:hypothetical protein [Acidobacteriota bacterium]MCB9383044.1 hypothetical protein [Bryobacterales bacterium]